MLSANSPWYGHFSGSCRSACSCVCPSHPLPDHLPRSGFLSGCLPENEPGSLATSRPCILCSALLSSQQQLPQPHGQAFCPLPSICQTSQNNFKEIKELFLNKSEQHNCIILLDFNLAVTLTSIKILCPNYIIWIFEFK